KRHAKYYVATPPWLLLNPFTPPPPHPALTSVHFPPLRFVPPPTPPAARSAPLNTASAAPAAAAPLAVRRAGGGPAEERTLASAWGMVRATVLRRSYPAAPVSDLYLLGRRHDFTYQQEVGGTTTKRHHVRFWRMPKDFVLPGGYRADWLAAGTYDRA